MKPQRPQPGAIKGYEASMPVVPDVGEIDSEEAPRALLVGGAGTVVGQLLGDTETRTFTLGAGIHELSFRVITPDSTATDMIALY